MIVRALGLTSEPVRPQRFADWLVLSADGRTRRAVLAAIARNGHVGHDATSRPWPLASLADDGVYRCAFVDLVHPAGGCLAEVARRVDALHVHRPRLVVRGHDGDHAAELWARQAGAAVFLPGEIDEAGIDLVVAQVSG
jgi:hypothetical protein